MQAVTRVNPEQASKGKSWMPTRLNNGEGSMGREATDARTGSVHRGNGNGMQARWLGSLGEARADGGDSNVGGKAGGPVWASERTIVPAKPGNAGGGKGPHFWSCF